MLSHSILAAAIAAFLPPPGGAAVGTGAQAASRSVQPEFVRVPDSGTLVLALLEPHGVLDDAPVEAGVARVVAAARLAAARSAVPAVRQSGSQVSDRSTVYFVTVEPANWAVGVRFLQALVAGTGASLTADDLAIAIAHAALAADDAEWLYPGWMLQSLARRALVSGPAGGRGLHGSATALQALRSARVRELMPWRGAVTYRVLGDVPAAVTAADFALTVPDAAPRGSGGGRPTAEPAAGPTASPGGSATASPVASPVGRPVARPAASPMGSPMAETATGSPTARGEPVQIPHSRVDGPFAVVGFAVPPALGGAGLAVVVEVARERALRRVPARIRGVHQRAQAPFVRWSWADSEPVLVLTRRGFGGDAPAVAFGAIDALLADLLAAPPTAAEVERAQAALGHELALLPWQRTAVVAPGRVLVAMRAAAVGIDRAAIAAVTPAAAHAALRAVVTTAPSYRAVLVPTVHRDPFRPAR